MNTAFVRFFILLVILASSACTDDTGDDPEGHLFESQERALERARNVEQDVAEAARRRAEQIDEQIEDSEKEG